MTNQSPRANHGHMLLGPATLRTLLWLRLAAKSERALGPGATVGLLGMVVPRFACLWPTVWLHQRPRMGHLHQQTLKTLVMGQAS